MHNKAGGVLRKQMKVAVPGGHRMWFQHVSHTHTSELHSGRVDVRAATGERSLQASMHGCVSA